VKERGLPCGRRVAKILLFTLGSFSLVDNQ
jgi:hypothetical protein